jgi:hypothetical protein
MKKEAHRIISHQELRDRFQKKAFAPRHLSLSHLVHIIRSAREKFLQVAADAILAENLSAAAARTFIHLRWINYCHC